MSQEKAELAKKVEHIQGFLHFRAIVRLCRDVFPKGQKMATSFHATTSFTYEHVPCHRIVPPVIEIICAG